ncbi:MAG: hypothetical protein JWO58_2821 [Chitinophagaceae bacterium]|nr:hypothetical protein [Chitinophagaceae bacterium]
MANCNDLFSGYHGEICIGKTKRDRMIGSKEALRKRIRKWFKDNHPDYDPKFFIQGSHKMKSGIRTKDDICDLDDGVYFFREPDVTSTTLQGWVWEAVNGYTETAPSHRQKCIRSMFAGDYEIDHPVYYKIDGQDYRLAIKNDGYQDSDPKAMVEWFDNQKDKNGKLIRQVMYLKSWCDQHPNKMPSGLAMTILASNAKDKIAMNDRDDITFRDLLKEIQKALNLKFECVVPAIPNDDLFADYDENRKKNFMTALNDLITDADEALKNENQLASSKLWKRHLGDRFPEGKDEKQNNSYTSAVVSAGASTSKPWACE